MQEHEHQLRDDKHDQTNHKNRTGLEHVDLGGHAEHGQSEEERRSDTQCGDDRTKAVHHEDGAQRKAHKRRVHIEHDTGGAGLHFGDASTEYHGKTHLNHTKRDEADGTGGCEERVIGSRHLPDKRHYRGDDDANGHFAVDLGYGSAASLLIVVSHRRVDGRCACTRALRGILVVLLRGVVIGSIVLRVVLPVVLGLLTECHNRSFSVVSRSILVEQC